MALSRAEIKRLKDSGTLADIAKLEAAANAKTEAAKAASGGRAPQTKDTGMGDMAILRSLRRFIAGGRKENTGVGSWVDEQEKLKEGFRKKQAKREARQQRITERRADMERRRAESQRESDESAARRKERQGNLWDRSPGTYSGSNLAGLNDLAGGAAGQFFGTGAASPYAKGGAAGAMGDPGAAGAAGAAGSAWSSPEQREAAGQLGGVGAAGEKRHHGRTPPGGLGELGAPEPGDQRYLQTYDEEPMDYTAQIRQNRQAREAGLDPRDLVADKRIGPIAPVPLAGIGGDEFGGMPGMEIAGGPPIDPGIMAQQFPPQTPPAASALGIPEFTPDPGSTLQELENSAMFAGPTPRPPQPVRPPWNIAGGPPADPFGEQFVDPISNYPVNPPRLPVPDDLIDPEWNTPSIMNDPSMVDPAGGPNYGEDPWGDRPDLNLSPEMPSQGLVPGGPGFGSPNPPRVRGPYQPTGPFPSGSNPATRRRASGLGNPTDMKTGQGVPISSAMPAPANNLRNLSRAGNWRGMV